MAQDNTSDVGLTCHAKSGWGTCIDVTSQKCSEGMALLVSEVCDGPANIQCCVTMPNPTPNRTGLMIAANALYDQRANEHYTEGSQRWSGISGNVHPPKAPPYSDCSAAVTWIYWTVYGSGPDFLNGESWKAGYTGTLIQHGKVVSLSAAQPGDLVFYGSSPSGISHTAVYIGNNQVISHGADPVLKGSIDYRSDRQFIRNYF